MSNFHTHDWVDFLQWTTLQPPNIISYNHRSATLRFRVPGTKPVATEPSLFHPFYLQSVRRDKNLTDPEEA